jgi:hypothetical protein
MMHGRCCPAPAPANFSGAQRMPPTNSDLGLDAGPELPRPIHPTLITLPMRN